jgi:hypothetical protein
VLGGTLNNNQMIEEAELRLPTRLPDGRSSVLWGRRAARLGSGFTIASVGFRLYLQAWLQVQSFRFTTKS